MPCSNAIWDESQLRPPSVPPVHPEASWDESRLRPPSVSPRRPEASGTKVESVPHLSQPLGSGAEDGSESTGGLGEGRVAGGGDLDVLQRVVGGAETHCVGQ